MRRVPRPAFARRSASAGRAVGKIDDERAEAHGLHAAAHVAEADRHRAAVGSRAPKTIVSPTDARRSTATSGAARARGQRRAPRARRGQRAEAPGLHLPEDAVAQPPDLRHTRGHRAVVYARTTHGGPPPGSAVALATTTAGPSGAASAARSAPARSGRRRDRRCAPRRRSPPPRRARRHRQPERCGPGGAARRSRRRSATSRSAACSRRSPKSFEPRRQVAHVSVLLSAGSPSVSAIARSPRETRARTTCSVTLSSPASRRTARAFDDPRRDGIRLVGGQVVERGANRRPQRREVGKRARPTRGPRCVRSGGSQPRRCERGALDLAALPEAPQLAARDREQPALLLLRGAPRNCARRSSAMAKVSPARSSATSASSVRRAKYTTTRSTYAR